MRLKTGVLIMGDSKETTTGDLYMIPSGLAEGVVDGIPTYVRDVLNRLDEFIVENERSARRYLKAVGYEKSLDTLILHLLNKRTEEQEIEHYLDNTSAGKSIGLLSEAGYPAIADPGAEIVRLAHLRGIKVIPLVGPSSLILALAASGMNGQNFIFHGYLPIKQHERIKAIKALEKEARRSGRTQIFMETPFRNEALVRDIIDSCQDNTALCIACDITLPTEQIMTKSIYKWKKGLPGLKNRPAIFLLNRSL